VNRILGWPNGRRKEQEMADYSVGDVVQLKSGGPLMTVIEVMPGSGSGPMVKCAWFDGPQGKPSFEFFRTAAVKDRRDVLK